MGAPPPAPTPANWGQGCMGFAKGDPKAGGVAAGNGVEGLWVLGESGI